MVYTVCTCVRFPPNLGKTDGKVCSSRSLESVVAHLEHLALCPRLFLSGRRLQPFLLLVNRWAPAPRFPSRTLSIHPHLFTKSRKVADAHQSGRDKDAEPENNYATVWCCGHFKISMGFRKIRHIRSQAVFPLLLIRKTSLGTRYLYITVRLTLSTWDKVFLPQSEIHQQDSLNIESLAGCVCKSCNCKMLLSRDIPESWRAYSAS